MKKKIIAIIAASCLLVCAVGLSFIKGSGRYIDVSGGRYDISKETEDFLKGLEKEVTLSVINADEKNPQMDIFLEKYAAMSDKVTLEYLKSDATAALLSEKGYGEYDSASFTPYSLVISSGDYTEVIDYYSLFYYSNSEIGFENISYSEYSYYMSAFAQDEQYSEYLNSLMYSSSVYFYGDTFISRAVDYVARDIIPHVYLVSGKGASDTKTGIFAQVLSSMGYGYGVFDISEEAIPADASAIVINNPTEDYTDAQTAVVLDYLKNGGRLIFVGGDKTSQMPNLMSIAEYYGISQTSELINFDKPAATEGEEPTKTTTFIPMLNTDHDIFANINSNYIPVVSAANPIQISASLRPAQIVTPILTTEDKAYTTDPEQKGVFNVGVCVEEETENGNTRVVWLSGGGSYNSQSSGIGTIAVLVYSMDWVDIHYESSITELNSALYTPPYLAVESGKVLSIASVTIFIIPVVIILSGVLVILKRKRG